MTTVAFQGEPGAFSEEAALRCFGPGVSTLPRRTFADVVKAVLTREAQHGIVPVENTLIGPVTAGREAAAIEGLIVEQEIWLPISQCLMARQNVLFDDVRRVLSHHAAIGQCRKFFETNPAIEAVEWYDTAGAAKHVAASSAPDIAAIASRRAAERYALRILLENIQDGGDNRTRFLVVAAR